MSNNLEVKATFNEQKFFNDGKEKNLKLCLEVWPSDELRKKLSDPENRRDSVDLCLVIACGQSMKKPYSNSYFNSESKLDIVIEGVKEFIEDLNVNDRVSIVSYASQGYTVINRVSADNKREILAALTKCYKYTGNGNLTAGLRTARTMFKGSKSSIKKIILITDGIVKLPDSARSVTGQAKGLNRDNITIDCIRVGEHSNYPLLQKLSSISGGKVESINGSSDVRRALSNLWHKTSEVIVSDVKVNIQFNRGVRVTDFYRGVPDNVYLGKMEPNPKNIMELNIGNIEIDQMYKYYFDVTIPSKDKNFIGEYPVVKLSLDYLIPALYDDTKQVQDIKDTVKIGYVKSLREIECSGTIDMEFALATVKRFEDEASEAKENKDMKTWIYLYEQIISIYENYGKTREMEEVIKLVNHYKATGEISERDLEITASSSTRGVGEILPPLSEEVYRKSKEIINKGRKL